jgi:hypothetical protein
MQIKHILTFLGAAALSTMALAAPPAPVSLSADGGTVIVQGEASPRVRLTQADVDGLLGAFRLEDGRVLKLTNEDRTVYMEVDGKREELLALAKTRFVGRTTGAELALVNNADKVTLSELRSR